jgi:protein SCO1/2
MTDRYRSAAPRRPLSWAAWLLLVLVFVPELAPVSLAQSSALVDPAQMPAPLNEVRFDQKLGSALPRDARFLDQDGRPVALGNYFGERPVVLAFVYYECPMLCTLILNGLAKSLGVLKLQPGTDFDVVAVSIDHGETPALASAALERTLKRYGKPETAPGWHFLTGSEEDVKRVADAAGFRFVYDPETDEYAHTSGIVIVAPDGTINQYYYGIEYPPRDVRLALVDASEGRAGTLVDQILLYCYRYDAKLGKYTVLTMRLLRFAGALFVVIMMIFLWFMWRFERRRNQELARSAAGAAKA